MAKGPKKSAINMKLLASIANATEQSYISKDDATPLLANDPVLIEVNTGMLDGNGNAAVRLTAAGAKLVADATPGTVATGEAPKASPYAIISNAVLPPSKRGNKGGGAPTQYPFADLKLNLDDYRIVYQSGTAIVITEK